MSSKQPRRRVTTSIYQLASVEVRGRALAKRCKKSYGVLLERLQLRFFEEIKAAEARGDPNPCDTLFD